jgi:hypothetical protein
VIIRKGERQETTPDRSEEDESEDLDWKVLRVSLFIFERNVALMLMFMDRGRA